jgi:hypothetical protein
VRPRLAAAAAASLDEIERVLIETATAADRQIYAMISCKHCGREGRYPVAVPDHRSRLDAISQLLAQGLGRPAQAEETATLTLPDDPEAIERLSWPAIRALAAIHDRDLLRLEIASLSEDQKQDLREALEAVA